MTRFQQLGIPATNPWRWEVVDHRTDGTLKSYGANRTKDEAQRWASMLPHGEVIDRAAEGTGDLFPTPMDR